MTQKLINDQTETILLLGAEGGSLTLYRRQIDGNQWQFWRVAYSMDIDENDDEVWRTTTFEPVTSWEALDQQLGTEWIVYSPRKIHPEYRDLIRAAVRQRIPQLDDNIVEHWRTRAQERWREVLHLDNGEAI